ncbi:phosphoheptose isomerase [Tamilnaduibacter salinus]|uniref:Phosphoheptose isomerase n=1 Tax=Tamilnaduibacter salinus TaxID=1484056 RepID=A0A2U1D096_9GAMM|nr:SIS domain-containing protein [Tamilnaduibacter salinus]PVY78812.1 phosphoheptose isomerase [Tamilnaduibacter salinus]
MADSPLLSSFFAEHMENAAQVAGELPEQMSTAADGIVETLLNDGKVMMCANGNANTLAQYFSTNLLNRFDQDRPALPAMNLGADGTTYSAICRDNRFNETFSRQVRALGKEGDLLVVIVDDGHKANLIQAIQAAHDRDMRVLILSAQQKTDAHSLLQQEDHALALPDVTPVQASTLFLLIVNALSALVDDKLFGG